MTRREGDGTGGVVASRISPQVARCWHFPKQASAGFRVDLPARDGFGLVSTLTFMCALRNGLVVGEKFGVNTATEL